MLTRRRGSVSSVMCWLRIVKSKMFAQAENNVIKSLREKWRSLWRTLPTPISEKENIEHTEISVWFQPSLYHRKPVWKVSLSADCECFRKLVSFYFKMSECAFYGISESYRECQWDSRVSKSAVCCDRQTLDRHLAFLLLQFFYKATIWSKFSENLQHYGSTAHFGGVTTHVIKSMAVWWPWPWPGSRC